MPRNDLSSGGVGGFWQKVAPGPDPTGHVEAMWWPCGGHALSSWSLTSVGDKKDDILFKGLRACQRHLSTNLLHHIQGHLGRGSEAVPAELTSVPQPAPGRRPWAEFLGASAHGRVPSKVSENSPSAVREDSFLSLRGAGLSLICSLTLSWKLYLPKAQSAPLRKKFHLVGLCESLGGLSALGGPLWRLGCPCLSSSHLLEPFPHLRCMF